MIAGANDNGCVPLRYTDFGLLNPYARPAFERLRDNLASLYVRGTVPWHFRPFETYRSPERQKAVYKTGNSRAVPWQSPHNYGLAVDFVPWSADRSWFWDIPVEDWSHLTAAARAVGMDAPLSWDRAHVEHPLWGELRKVLFPNVA